MLISDLIFIPAVLFIGVITAYEDIKIGKIRLKWIKLGLIYALTGYGIFFLLNIFNIVDYGGINFTYLTHYFANAFISLIASYMLWKMDAWAAGDAKLFVIYALLIPLSYYSKGYLPYFPSFALLLNIFLPIFLFLFLIAVVSLIVRLLKLLTKRNKMQSFTYWIEKTIGDHLILFRKSRRQSIAKILGYVCMFVLADVLGNIFKLTPIAIVLFMLVCFKPFIDFMTKSRKFMIICAVSLIFYFIWEVIAGKGSLFVELLWRIFRLIFLYGIIRLVLNLYIKHTQVYEINITNLKPKMVVNEDDLGKLEEKTKGFRKQLGVLYPDGLLAEQAELIRQICAENKQDVINVHKTFSFAVWMTEGVIVTLLLKQDVLHYFLSVTKINIRF